MGIRNFLLIFCAILGGCAGPKVKRTLDAKLSQEPTISSNRELENQIDKFLSNAPQLDYEKRAQINALRDETREQLQQIRADVYRRNVVLIKELLSHHDDRGEVKILKSQLIELEQKKLHVLLAAVGQANLISGRWPSKDARLKAEFAPQPQFPPR